MDLWQKGDSHNRLVLVYPVVLYSSDWDSRGATTTDSNTDTGADCSSIVEGELMHHRFIIGLVALGLAISLTPNAPIHVEIQPKQVVPKVVEIPDLELDQLPIAWQKLAMCESSGRLNAVSGKRKQFQGAFQIEYPRTWIAHGGASGKAPKDSTLLEQFWVALHIYVDRGSSPWPYCGRFLKAEYGK